VSGRRGFTLLELLVALVVAAVAAGVLAQGLLASSLAGRAAADRRDALRWAQGLLAAAAFDPELAAQPGGTHPAGFTWTLTRRVLPAPLAAPDARDETGTAGLQPALVELTVTVSLATRARPAVVTLTSAYPIVIEVADDAE
jgi:prepilin-type N-terminal cleavage/methylation domain-containing protein